MKTKVKNPELTVVAKWLKKKDYIQLDDVQRTFGLNERKTCELLNFMVDLGYVDRYSTSKGIKVLRHNYPLVRVVGKTLRGCYQSRAVSIKEGIYFIKELLHTLPKESDGRSLIQLVEDHGNNYNYQTAPGFFRFTNSTIRPDFFEEVEQWLM